VDKDVHVILNADCQCHEYLAKSSSVKTKHRIDFAEVRYNPGLSVCVCVC